MQRISFVLLFVVLLAAFTCAPQPLRAAPGRLPPKFTRVALGGGQTLEEPTAIAFPDVRIFVTEKGGRIRIIKRDGSLKPTPFATLNVNTEGERGLLGIALDPNYNTNHFIYVYYTTGPGAKNYSGKPENRVSRLFKSSDGRVTETIIKDHISSSTTHSNHNGGDIHFGFDGKLYIAVGENGCCPDDAQRLSSRRGKILRINADGTIPSDNPFFNNSGAPRAIFAYGFRNPWRFTLRSSNQTYIVADVGQGTWEEIDWLQVGKNYGWPLYEGPCPSNNLACNPSSVNYNGTVKPIHWYKHSGGGETGSVISGGVFAEHSNYPAPYANSYFYGDAGQGWVHVLELDQNNVEIARHDFDQLNSPVSFGLGKDGNVYVVDYGAGIVYKYVYTP